MSIQKERNSADGDQVGSLESALALVSRDLIDWFFHWMMLLTKPSK